MMGKAVFWVKSSRVSWGIFWNVRALLFLMGASVGLLGPVHADSYWLFAGQSNMAERSQSRVVFNMMKEKGVRPIPKMLAAQNDGKPIQFWYPENKGGQKLDAAFANVGEGKLDAFVWQQGESNQGGWYYYGQEVKDLIDRVRKRSGNMELPVYLNQLGPRYRKKGNSTLQSMNASNKAGRTHFVSFWDMGLMREVQRRVALADPNVHLVMVADLTIHDGWVHLDGDSHREIGRRIGELHTKGAGGAIPYRVMRDPANPKVLLLKCVRVSESLKIVDGWKENAALSSAPSKPIPSAFEEWPPEEGMHPTLLLPPDELRYPVDANLRAPDIIAFTFKDPIQAGDLFHWCFKYGSNPEGVTEGVQASLTGITDASGVTLASAALLPVETTP